MEVKSRRLFSGLPRVFLFFRKIYAYKPKKQTYLMQRNEFEKTKSYIVSRLKKIPEVKAVYLFGSYATGKEKPISDIDLCVITKRDISKSKKLEILSYAGRTVEISLFFDIPISVKAKIFKEGILLFSKDKRLLADLRLAAMKEYLDFKPTLERFTRLYIGGLRGKSR